ncbi:MAG: hypothetical protein AAF519_06035 [Bacteroidota bacterium]
MEITNQRVSEVREVLALGWTHFEDAMQMALALSSRLDRSFRLDRIITSDKK